MSYKKLSSGFLIRDLADAPVSCGIVRLAPKILQSGAEQLARSATYLFAAHKKQIGGAAGAINAKPEKRNAGIASFLNDISHLVSEGSFLPDPGKGLTEKDLSPIRAGDSRAEIRLMDMGGCTLSQYCTGLSAVTAMGGLLNGLKESSSRGSGSEEDGLENKSIAIEGFNENAVGAVAQIQATGAKLIGIGTEQGFVNDPAGFDLNAVLQSWSAYQEDNSRAGFLDHLDYEITPSKKVWQTPVDVLLVGSKMGALDHSNADGLEISALGCTHPIPYTTRALMILQKKGVVVAPDFLCLGGQVQAGWPKSESGPGSESGPEQTSDEILKNVVEETKLLVAEMHERENKELDASLFLAGCEIAEDFLKTWQTELPFGRPLA